MNVRDYVRTNLRNEIVIRKVIDIIHSTSMNDNRMVFDKPTKFTYYVEDNGNYKSSPQIIDLIEENDYIRIITDTDFRRIYNSYGKLVIYRGKELPIETFSNDFISEIITHEQMEAMQYRVEE